MLYEEERHEKILKKWKRLVYFLGKALGPNYEIFLYDLTKEEHPIVAIENGHLSGRRVGSLMKNIIVKIYDEEEPINSMSEDLLIRHDAISREGRQFKSSTMLIRDDEGEPLVAFCINYNIQPLLDFQSFLSNNAEDLSQVKNIDVDDVIFSGEVFSESNLPSLETIYERTLEKLDPVDLQSPKDRQRVVDKFYQDGGFSHKNAVNMVAKSMDISEPTIYRYLSKAKEKNQGQED